MTKTVTISEAQTQLPGLLALARDNGDEIIIEENGEPLAKLTPIEKPQVQNREIGFAQFAQTVSIGFEVVYQTDFFERQKMF